MQKKFKWSLIIAVSFLLCLTLVLGIVFLNIKVQVPSVTGKTSTEATEAIKKVGLQVDYLEEFSFTVAKDTVISQDIEAGKKLKRGNIVTLRVSAGFEQVVVPNLQNVHRYGLKKSLKN